MELKNFAGASLKSRISVLALAIFIASIWSLTLYARQALREDLQDLLGEQQLSTARLVAAEVEQALVDRMRGLQAVAQQITAAQLRDPARLQAFLEDKRWTQLMFSAGVYATGLDGTAIASVPQELGRTGTNFRERAHLVAALERGETSVSEPVMGKFLKQPVISISTPVRDAQGRVMGALVGVINLQEPNFLDHIVALRYGRTGGYLIVDARHGLFVTATDKSYILQHIPEPGTNPMSDRYRRGYEGYGLTTNSRGLAQMTAASQIPSAGWYVVVRLPVEEAFSPIRAMEWRLLGAAMVFTLLAASLLWWMLSRNLEPLALTARKLKALSQSDSFPHALPVPATREIGDVIVGFNHLLSNLRQREASIYQSEKRFRAMTEGSPQAVVVHRNEVLVYVNPAAVLLFGAGSGGELLGRALADIAPAPHHPAAQPAHAPATRGLPHVQERSFQRLDGEPFEAEVHSCTITFDGMPAVQVTLRDLTEQHRHEEHVRNLSRIVEQAPMAIAITDLHGNIEYTNPWFSAVTGYSAEELQGKNPRQLQSGLTPASSFESLWQTLLAGKVWHGEFYNRRKSGEVFVESATVAPVQDRAGQVTHYVALKEDITLRKQTEAALQDSLRDKVALLHEVHHRVKNNLQVITSMLRLEAARSAQGETRSVLRDMQGRIRSMALLHETLYRSGTLASIDLADYLQQLATQAFRAQALSQGTLRLAFALQPLAVDMDMATPCGLLVNELLTNSLKHAFAAGQDGEIRISLQPQPALPGAPEQPWLLRVSDTGAGLPPDFAQRRSQSLGLQLVADLVRQLRGTLVVEPGPGTAFAVHFSVRAQPPA
jgi:PAS domain S-box-containing protein